MLRTNHVNKYIGKNTKEMVIKRKHLAVTSSGAKRKTQLEAIPTELPAMNRVQDFMTKPNKRVKKSNKKYTTVIVTQKGSS